MAAYCAAPEKAIMLTKIVIHHEIPAVTASTPKATAAGKYPIATGIEILIDSLQSETEDNEILFCIVVGSVLRGFVIEESIPIKVEDHIT